MKRFSISDVECLTGIKAHTIRIWEQRYGLIEAKRTDTNIRYYNNQDLKKFLNISFLQEHGYRISEVADLSIDEMNHVVNQLISKNDQSYSQKALCNAMVTLDELSFNNTIDDYVKEIGLERTMVTVINPFLDKVAIMWQTGAINHAHEHFITYLIKQRLIAAINSIQTVSRRFAKRYMLFLPYKESYDVQLLFINYLIKSRGHHVLYLGQSLSIEDIYKVANYYDPDYAITILTSDTSFGNVNIMLQKIMEQIPHWPLLVTGAMIRNNTIHPLERMITFDNTVNIINFLNQSDEVGTLQHTC